MLITCNQPLSPWWFTEAWSKPVLASYFVAVVALAFNLLEVVLRLSTLDATAIRTKTMAILVTLATFIAIVATGVCANVRKMPTVCATVRVENASPRRFVAASHAAHGTDMSTTTGAHSRTGQQPQSTTRRVATSPPPNWPGLRFRASASTTPQPDALASEAAARN